MTTPIFNLDDEVETTDGKRFKISQIWKNQDGSISYSALGEAYHPASSLRLVEELKIGDWVEHDDIVFQIADISDGEPYYLHRSGKTFEKWYHPSALRKLTPEEITKHLCHQRGEFASEERLDSLEEYARDNDARLSAIEKQLEEQQKKISQFNGEIGHLIGSIQECLIEAGDVEARTKCREMQIEKRLAFVEKIQRDQDNLMGRAIRDGVAEIADFRRK